MRFKDRDLKTELAILEPVSWVELAGSCDEGQFRQAWRSAESGRLERFGVSPSAAQAAKTNEVDHAGGKENQATIWGIHD
jgi:hypothetical protein